VRDRERIMRADADFKPDIVFHAAALKHVPLLERDWGEGVKTNVFGSVNVADAAVAAGAGAMVMISTDKAIEPVSVLGATKRFAEMYARRSTDGLARARPSRPPRMRLIAVRFGNVLASNGSVVPKFKAQIEAGGPVTVTHPDMVRYFMTIREACDLVVTAASHALGPERIDVSVYVLNMGQPVKIVELAERMIRCPGSSPAATSRSRSPASGRASGCTKSCSRATSRRARSASRASWRQSRAVRRSSDAGWLATLEQGLARDDRSVIYGVLRDAVPDFRGEANHRGDRGSRCRSPAASRLRAAWLARR
jgi:nucleoside-diphosphate-sugar epimerase